MSSASTMEEMLHVRQQITDLEGEIVVLSKRIERQVETHDEYTRKKARYEQKLEAMGARAGTVYERGNEVRTAACYQGEMGFQLGKKGVKMDDLHTIQCIMKNEVERNDAQKINLARRKAELESHLQYLQVRYENERHQEEAAAAAAAMG